MQPGSIVLVNKIDSARHVVVTVESAVNYGSDDQPNWYIEGRLEGGRPCYVKQRPDGVEITRQL